MLAPHAEGRCRHSTHTLLLPLLLVLLQCALGQHCG